MKKQLLIIACLAAIPFAAMSEEDKHPGKAKKPAPAASAPAPAAAASAVDSRVAVQESRKHNTALASCQGQALQQNLSGMDRKQFVINCMAGK